MGINGILVQLSKIRKGKWDLVRTILSHVLFVLLTHFYSVNDTAEFGLGSSQPEPAQKGKNSLPSRYASGPYRPPQMEQKESISLSSPEAGEKHNPYGYNRKRPRNPYYGTDKWSENPKPAPKEDTSSDDDAQEALPTSFVTARHKLVIFLDHSQVVVAKFLTRISLSNYVAGHFWIPSCDSLVPLEA
jgi:hypothetical protein